MSTRVLQIASRTRSTLTHLSLSRHTGAASRASSVYLRSLSSSSADVNSSRAGHAEGGGQQRRAYGLLTGGMVALLGLLAGNELANGRAARARAESAVGLETKSDSGSAGVRTGGKASGAGMPKPESQELINWSGTHTVSTDRFYQPESIDELKRVVLHAHHTRQKLRPVGSALSPNGLPFSGGGMVSLSNMDKVRSIDAERGLVVVEAGARVNQVVEALRPHGLTLQNYASITEQQIGGFTQVGAHGTGVRIPPVDDQVKAIRLISPGVGEVMLAESDDDNSLFHVARTAVGLLGVVAEVTLQCVPAHKLRESTFVLSRAEVAANHEALMGMYKHLRYMWIPHTDDVVVVGSNPAKPTDSEQQSEVPMPERLKPAQTLLLSHPKNTLTADQVRALQFTALRDELLALDPLDVAWMRRVNQTEAHFWRQSQGVRIDWSDRILQFDCGGQQWVSEVAFPIHRGAPEQTKKHRDIAFMNDLLEMIDDENIAAPAPIEQRWTAPSVSPMSPACERPDKKLGDYYAWVGIIMYLPDEEANPETRKNVTAAFQRYKQLCEKRLWNDYHAVEHWAKIELPKTEEDKARLQKRTAEKYPTEAFKALAGIFDPHGILRNELTESIFGPFPSA